MRHIAWKQVAWLLTLAVIVRLGAAAYWHHHWHGQFVFGDSQGYFDLARAIAHGEPYQLATGEEVFRAPGYPLLLSPVLWLWDGPRAVWAARVESCLFGSLTVLAVAAWAWQVFGPRAAWIAGLITAIYPEAVAISVPVLSEAPFCLLVAVNMARLDGRVGNMSVVRFIRRFFADCCTSPCWPSGFSGRLRPRSSGRVGCLFLPFALACGLIYGQRRRQLLLAAADVRWLRRGDAALVGEKLSGHGSFRAHDVAGRCKPLRWLEPAGHGGQRHAFRAGLRSGPDGSTTRTARGDGFEYRLDRHFSPGGLGLGLGEPWPGRAACRDQVPADVEFLAQRALLYGLAGADRRFVYLHAADAAGRAGRALCAPAIGWPIVLCWLPAVYFSLLHTVFVSSIRYRQPALLGLIVLAAGYLAEFAKPPQTSTRDRCHYPQAPDQLLLVLVQVGPDRLRDRGRMPGALFLSPHGSTRSAAASRNCLPTNIRACRSRSTRPC